MKVLRLDPIHWDIPGLLVLSTMVETFMEHGHQFVESADRADLALFDLSCGTKKYDSVLLQSVVDARIPVVVFDQFEYSNPPATDRTWLGRWTKYDIEREISEGFEWAFWMKKLMENRQVKLCFMQRMPSRWMDFPDFVRPMDLTLFPGHDFPPVDSVTLNSRPYDVCFLGESAPHRLSTLCGLAKGGFKMDCEIIRCHKRMPRNDWLERHRKAKLFFSGDGPGDCCDRPVQLICLAVRLTIRHFHRLPAPWTHGVNCIRAADEMGVMNDDDVKIIRDFLESPEKLHQIYLNGIEHVHKHCTPKARTEYILRELKMVGIS